MSTTTETSIGSIWDSSNLALTLGSILAVTLGALEGLGVATIAPVIADDLHGKDVYGWIFAAFILPQIIGTILAGREVDRRQPAIVFYSALAIFGIGCIAAGSATSIWMLFAGRALQGFGAGGSFATVYAIISGAYNDRLRPSMLAALSSAWILPSLIGPVIFGFVADHFSWRYVFWGLVPVILIIGPLTFPAYRKVRLDHDPTTVVNDRRVTFALVLATGTGLFLAGPDLRPIPLAAVVTVAGLALLIPMLKNLLPEGTFGAKTMLGAAIANRALLFGGFGVTETYMVFSLKEFGGVSTSLAGIVLTVGSLTWTAGSILQARWDREVGPESRPLRVRVGNLTMLAGACSVFGMVVIFRDIWEIPAAIFWLLTGLGMGLAYTTSTTLAFAHAPRGQDGMVSSSTLLGDLFASSVGVGVGGVLLALTQSLGWSTPASAALSLSLGLTLMLLAFAASMRMWRMARA
ncbi:MAG TPA: MFS transporter [Thermomicrobiales bacterium]|nr:MFS transporter [Thermomicrobiales bacterium]